jgi:tRNA G18 (ribose-2'-O)-methylase SpoU
MMKRYVQQSIWPVSVFGLGFLLLIMGLSGVANIQETRRIHQQILAVEDNYRHVENLVEGIRADTSQVAVLRRDRLLDTGARAEHTRQLAEVRQKTEASLDQLRALRPQQESKAYERLTSTMRAYLDAVAVEFRESPGSGNKP